MIPMTSRISAAILAFGLMIANSALAQRASVHVRALAFSPQLQSEDVFAHDPAAAGGAAAARTPIKTFLNHENALLELTGREVVFTTNADRASLKDQSQIVAKVTFPSKLQRAILLFLPKQADEAGAAKVMVVPDSPREFPAGSFRITNLSPVPVQIQLEGKNFNFKPGDTQTIENPPMGEADQAAMRAFAIMDGQPRRIGSGFWPDPGTRRVVQVLYQDPASGRVQLRGFRDIPPRDFQTVQAAQ
jgi:hypothetical protein